MRVMVKRILRKYGTRRTNRRRPPTCCSEQAEVICRRWRGEGADIIGRGCPLDYDCMPAHASAASQLDLRLAPTNWCQPRTSKR